MEWISIEDTLPHHKEEIKFKGKFPFVCEGFFEKLDKEFNFFHLNKKEKKIYSIYGVTHWMPLPEPPEK